MGDFEAFSVSFPSKGLMGDAFLSSTETPILVAIERASFGAAFSLEHREAASSLSIRRGFLRNRNFMRSTRTAVGDPDSGVSLEVSAISIWNEEKNN